MGKQRAEQICGSDTDSHVPSSSPRAAGALHREISRLKSLSRALRLSLKVKQKAGGAFSGGLTSEVSAGHGSVRQTPSFFRG